MTKFFASLHNRLFELRSREEGQTFAEYALIIALVAILLITATLFFQGKVDAVLSQIGNRLHA